jgi:hypothetical protein
MSKPGSVYRERLDRGRAALEELDRRFSRVATARLVVFIVAVGLAAWTIAARGGWPLSALGLVAVVFALLIVWHERVARARARAGASVGYFERGLARLDGTWTGAGDDGERFRDDQHLYSSDLELFGRGSLFHLISTARTETGASTLASWLEAPAERETILARQAAIRELAPNLDLRHDLGIVGPEARAALDSPALRRWALETGPEIPSWLPIAAAVLAAVNVVAVTAGLTGAVRGYVPAVTLFLSALLVLRVRPMVAAILQQADRPARDLRLLALLLERLRSERFQSAMLLRLAQVWSGSPRSAPALVGRLERMMDLVDARRNQLFLPISGVLLLGTQLAFAIERWRRQHGSEVAKWLVVVGEFEALVALATQTAEHPEDILPEIGAEGSPVEVSGLAHPLLPVDRAVRNDVRLGGEHRLLIVSGSNMSGKSTLLKAIGTNLVLGFAGGSVRATRLATGPLALGASLVLRESLLEGRSRFFAEVLRLRAIAEMAGGKVPILFLLDELLSGTNSHDRAIGARGVLLGLVHRNAIGIVTTHDLALTEIANDPAARASNWHFDDELRNGELVFDYRLKPGRPRPTCGRCGARGS